VDRRPWDQAKATPSTSKSVNLFGIVRAAHIIRLDIDASDVVFWGNSHYAAEPDFTVTDMKQIARMVDSFPE
jgi:hypothetical protein